MSDVDGHGVVAEAPHLVGGEVLVRGLPQEVLLACNITTFGSVIRVKNGKETQPDSRNNMCIPSLAVAFASVCGVSVNVGKILACLLALIFASQKTNGFPFKILNSAKWQISIHFDMVKGSMEKG